MFDRQRFNYVIKSNKKRPILFRLLIFPVLNEDLPKLPRIDLVG